MKTATIKEVSDELCQILIEAVAETEGVTVAQMWAAAEAGDESVMRRIMAYRDHCWPTIESTLKTMGVI